MLRETARDCEYEDANANIEHSFDSISDAEKQNNQATVIELRKQIGRLPFEQRNALLLKLDAGLSLDEIAHILDCGKETVKSRLRYATSKLKDLLTEPSGAQKNER